MRVSISVHYWQNAMPSPSSYSPTTVFKLSLHKSNMTSWPANVRHFLVVKEYIYPQKKFSYRKCATYARILFTISKVFTTLRGRILKFQEYYIGYLDGYTCRWKNDFKRHALFYKSLFQILIDRIPTFGFNKKNEKNQIDWLFFWGLFDGYILWNFKQNSSHIPSNPSYWVHFPSSFSFFSLFRMLFDSKFRLLLSWINVSIWLIELT